MKTYKIQTLSKIEEANDNSLLAEKLVRKSKDKFLFRDYEIKDFNQF